MAIINVEMKKTGTENPTSLIRRFSRKMQEAGIIQKVKSKRYSERAPSALSQKTMALRRIIRRKEAERLKKLGKL
ncbi:MAG TPA: hypothetical protein VLB02_00155 [Candidatus Paceibacterota bacterium]|nr:hypothetical protein [Candidatus Paceibacterota bacterium]